MNVVQQWTVQAMTHVLSNKEAVASMSVRDSFMLMFPPSHLKTTLIHVQYCHFMYFDFDHSSGDQKIEK